MFLIFLAAYRDRDHVEAATSSKLTIGTGDVPYIWRVNYRNNLAQPEKVLEIAHRKAREFLSRAATSTR